MAKIGVVQGKRLSGWRFDPRLNRWVGVYEESRPVKSQKPLKVLSAVRHNREMRGVSINALARFCGTNARMVIRYERGLEIMPAWFMEKAAKMLCCQKSDLISASDSKVLVF